MCLFICFLKASTARSVASSKVLQVVIRIGLADNIRAWVKDEEMKFWPFEMDAEYLVAITALGSELPALLKAYYDLSVATHSLHLSDSATGFVEKSHDYCKCMYVALLRAALTLAIAARGHLQSCTPKWWEHGIPRKAGLIADDKVEEISDYMLNFEKRSAIMAWVSIVQAAETSYLALLECFDTSAWSEPFAAHIVGAKWPGALGGQYFVLILDFLGERLVYMTCFAADVQMAPLRKGR